MSLVGEPQWCNFALLFIFFSPHKYDHQKSDDNHHLIIIISAICCRIFAKTFASNQILLNGFWIRTKGTKMYEFFYVIVSISLAAQREKERKRK